MQTVLCCFFYKLGRLKIKKKKALVNFNYVKNDLDVWISVHRKIVSQKENPGIKQIWDDGSKRGIAAWGSWD